MGTEEELENGRKSGMANQLPLHHAKVASGSGSSKTSKAIPMSDRNGVRTEKMAPGCVTQHTSGGSPETSKAIPLFDRNGEASGHVPLDTMAPGCVPQHTSGEQSPRSLTTPYGMTGGS